MQRRGKSTQTVKGQRALRLKARKASNRSTADLQEQVPALTRELREAREQQAATSEVLNIISSSAGELQPVFDTIVERVARLCDALYSVIWLYDGNLLRYAGSHNFTPEVLEQILKTFPKRPDRSLSAGRAVLDGRISHIPDLLADHAYAHDLALARELASVPRRPLAASWQTGRCHFSGQDGSNTILGATDSVDYYFRRPSGDCHREHAAPH